ncbi:MAG: ribosome maturation factor RimM [Actinomycetales bacterium]
MRFVVGRIGKPHGIKGAVMVDCRTDEPERRFAVGADLLVAGGVRTLQVAQSDWHGGRLRVRFVSADSRQDAESLRGLVLEVERDADEQPVDPDEFYDSDLVGCQAWLPDGRPAGVVAEVVHLPAQDLLVIRDQDGHDTMVPFVQQIVPAVDLPARRIDLDPPDGLFQARA